MAPSAGSISRIFTTAMRSSSRSGTPSSVWWSGQVMRKMARASVFVALALTTAWRVGATPQAGQTRLPVERAANIFFARGMVNGAGPLWFTLDTGANLSVLDPSSARSLGLVVNDAGRQPGVGTGTGMTQLGRARG